MNPTTETSPRGASPGKKPRLALLVASALGVGYIPKAPGSFGSLVGIFVAILSDPIDLMVLLVPGVGVDAPMTLGKPVPGFVLLPPLIVLVLVAMVGVWSASRAAEYSGIQDPQYVVIDEVSGMHLTLVLALVPLWLPTQLVRPEGASGFALYAAMSLLNWKYLLAGFILFRVFDIWKPYPIRRLEKLRGGWGIMADDWMAGVYAAAVLRLLIQLGLI